MHILHEAPWYIEIRREGVESSLIRLLTHRFGPMPSELPAILGFLNIDQLLNLIDDAVGSKNWDEFMSKLPTPNYSP